jgi:hypothetical protein
VTTTVLAVICTCRHGRAQHAGRDAICTLCDCPHFTAAGSVTPTASRASGDASPRVEPIHSESAEPTRRCSKCHEVRPRDEFHRDARASDGRTTTCKNCVAAKPYKPTLLRVVKTRARKRALAELARRHPDEFRVLLCGNTRPPRCKKRTRSPPTRGHAGSTAAPANRSGCDAADPPRAKHSPIASTSAAARSASATTTQGTSAPTAVAPARTRAVMTRPPLRFTALVGHLARRWLGRRRQADRH